MLSIDLWRQQQQTGILHHHFFIEHVTYTRVRVKSRWPRHRQVHRRLAQKWPPELALNWRPTGENWRHRRLPTATLVNGINLNWDNVDGGRGGHHERRSVIKESKLKSPPARRNIWQTNSVEIFKTRPAIARIGELIKSSSTTKISDNLEQTV